MLAAGCQLHQIAARVDQGNVGANAGEGDGRAFMNLDAQTVGDKAHHAGRFDPWNLLQLLFARGERDKEDIAADVSAEYFHYLRVRDVLGAGDFDLLAGIDAKTPGMFAVTVDRKSVV